MITLFTVDASPYLYWQSNLLAWSFQRQMMPGRLVRLMATNDWPMPLKVSKSAETFVFPITAGDYSPLNKPYLINEWLKKSKLSNETVLLLDPDCLFLKPLTIEVMRDNAIGHYMWYMDLRNNLTDKDKLYRLVTKHGVIYPEAMWPVGIPLLINSDNLKPLASLWYQIALDLLDDGEARGAMGWVLEMWAYCIAAGKLGIPHASAYLAMPLSGQGDLPLVHYTHDVSVDNWKWGKRSYKAWERVPEPPESAPKATQATVRMLNELVSWIRKGET